MTTQPTLFDLGPMSAGTVYGDGRRADDYYPTADWCTDAILPHLPVGGTILEPTCGDGAILRRLLAHTRPTRIVGVELDAGRAEQARGVLRDADYHDGEIITGDFLHWAKTARVPGLGLIIGNPPFSLALDVVKACIALAAPTRATVAMFLRLAFLRLAFLESAERAPFHHAHPSDVYPLARRPSHTGDGKTDMAAYAWFCFGPGRIGRVYPPILGSGA